MKLRTILSKANDILKYWQNRRKRRLYKQWVEMAGLPPEAVPQEEVAEDIMPKIDKKHLRLPMLYMLLGATLAIVGVGLVLLIMHSC